MSTSSTEDSRDKAYLEHFGLQRHPFVGAAGPDAVYLDSERQQRLDLLYHLAPYSQLLLIVGPLGSGKTTLVEQLIRQGNDNWQVCQIRGDETPDGHGLLAHIGRSAAVDGAGSGDEEAELARLRAHFQAQRQQAQMPILVVEAAERLSAQAAQAVARLCTGEESLTVSCLLVADTADAASLQGTPLAELERIAAHTFDMPPLSEQATAAYLRHRMVAAGGSDTNVFPAAVIKRIHKAAGGLPGRINELAHGVLRQRTPLGEQGRAGSGWLGSRPLILGVGIAAALALGALLWLPGGGEAPSSDEGQALQLPPPDEPDESTASGELERGRLQRSPSAEPAPPEPVAPSLPDVPAIPESIPTEPQLSAPPATSADADSPATAPDGEPTRRIEDETPAPPVPAETPANHGGDWLQGQEADGFTLQLMAVSEAGSARRFIERHDIEGQSSYFPIKRDNETLYVLIYGAYGSREAAQQAARELPAAWGDIDPWIRRFEAVQKAAGG